MKQSKAAGVGTRASRGRQVDGPRVLYWDLETSHNILAKFSLREEYVPHTAILQERFIICAAWKWQGEKRVETASILDDRKRFEKSVADDYHVVKVLHDVMSQADVIVAHNGDKFDIKWLNGRVLYHGLLPLPPIRSVDTYKVAKKHFNLNSNRLDYLGQYLGLGRKKSTPPGLWIDVLKGSEKAVQRMVAYNKGDVTLLERVYKRLMPFSSDAVNRALWNGADEKQCPHCDSRKVQARGYKVALTQIYRQFQCQACGKWFRARTAEKGRAASTRVI